MHYIADVISGAFKALLQIILFLLLVISGLVGVIAYLIWWT